MRYLLISVRSVFFYVIITILYKLMGKREIGELSIIDLIVSLLLAQLVAISIENYDENIILYLLPIVILVLLQILVSILYLKNKKARDIMDGKPSIIIKRGKVNFEEMKKQKYNLDDLLTSLRSEKIKSISEVDFALLETNGNLSVFKKDPNDTRYPLAVIQDGEIEKDVLIEINKTKEWLLGELSKKKIELEDVFYGFLQNNDLYIIETKNIKWHIPSNKNNKIIMVIKWKKYSL